MATAAADQTFRDDCAGDPYAPKPPHKRLRSHHVGEQAEYNAPGVQADVHESRGSSHPYSSHDGGWHGGPRGYQQPYGDWHGQPGGGAGYGPEDGAGGGGYGWEGDEEGRGYGQMDGRGGGYGSGDTGYGRRGGEGGGYHGGGGGGDGSGERYGRGGAVEEHPVFQRDRARPYYGNGEAAGRTDDARYRHYRQYDDHDAARGADGYADAPAEYAGVDGYEDLPVSFGKPRAAHPPARAHKRARGSADPGQYNEQKGYDAGNYNGWEGDWEWHGAGEWDETADDAHGGKPAGKREREDAAMGKYWAQRYRLFSRFDDGVRMDRVSWYSVTPEKIASHIARRFRSAGCRSVVDAFCGAAGNAIQFARVCGGMTVAIELCQSRLAIARHNAGVYGVGAAIDFVNGDAYRLLKGMRGVDAVFLSPPWGGPTYLDGKFRLEVFKDIVETARRVTDKVAILVPKNIVHADAVKCFGECEIEENYLGGRLKTVTIYFGGLVREGKVTASEDWEEEG